LSARLITPRKSFNDYRTDRIHGRQRSISRTLRSLNSAKLGFDLAPLVAR
jgi:hypothetical protein